MKTKIKRHSRSVISVVLALCMLVSCMTVGIIATDAANVQSESVGESNSFTKGDTIYVDIGTTWYENYPNTNIPYAFFSYGSSEADNSSYQFDRTALTQVSGSIFSVTVPNRDYMRVVRFERCNANNTSEVWDSVTTSKDDARNNNMFTISSWHDNGGWSTYIPQDTPVFSLVGNISSDYIVGSSISESTLGNDDTKKWGTHYSEFDINTGSNGVYSITFTTVSAATLAANNHNVINVGLFADGIGQYGFRKGSTDYNSIGSDLPVPSNGFSASDNVYVKSGKGSIILQPDTTYTITIDQTQRPNSGDVARMTIAVVPAFDLHIESGSVGSNWAMALDGRMTQVGSTAVYERTKELTANTTYYYYVATPGAGEKAGWYYKTSQESGTKAATLNTAMPLGRYFAKEGASYGGSQRMLTFTPTTSGSYKFTFDYSTPAAPTLKVENAVVTTPNYYLIGDVGTDCIETINGSAVTGTSAWPGDPNFSVTNETLVQTGTANSGIYSITLKTKNVDWAINVGLYEKSTSTQRGYKLGDTWYNTVGADYTVPYAGVSAADNLYIVTGTGSLVLLPDTEYTITIDQTQQLSGYPYGKITITTNKASVTPIAKVKRFDLSTGALSTTVSNATAAIGTATAVPASGLKNFEAVLTANVTDPDNYTFDGWYTDAACTTGKDTTNPKTVTVSESVSYYALFVENTLAQYSYSATVSGGNGSVAYTSGTGVDTANSKVYKGGTLVFTASPSTGYIIDTATSTSGVVSVSGNTITVSNITAQADVTVTFKVIPTYTITIAANSASYGKVSSVSYTNGSGAAATASNITTSTNITIQQGTTVSLTAEAGSSGQFNGWTLTGSYQRSKDTPLSGTTIDIKPSADMTVTALFENMPATDNDHGVNIVTKPDGSSTDSFKLRNYSSATFDGKTGYYKNTVTLDKAGTYTFYYYDKGTNYTYHSAQQNISVDSKTWRSYAVQSTKSEATDFSLTITEPGEYSFYYKYADKNLDGDDNLHRAFYAVVKGSGSSGSGGDDDDIDTSDYTKLYVFDGIVTRYNNSIQTYGTNTFGTTVISKATSGVAKTNYYDATDAEQLISTDAGHDEGQLIYYYDPTSELDFRVQTTINANHQAIGVRAFVMNGMAYTAKKASDGTYYADITLDANAGQGVLEVIPVYYNVKIPAKDYIKFYVDANSIGDNWGKNIGYSVWYTDKDVYGETGGYPGQPLMSDGTQLYGYIPKYYVGVNDSDLPAEEDYKKFSGVLITDLAEHNYTHQDVLSAWEVSGNTDNKQSFDYEDPYYISQISSVDMIKFETKYNTYFGSSRYEMFGKDSTVKTSSHTWPSSLDSNKPTGENQNFELLKDIDGKPVNIFNEAKGDAFTDTHTLYVISVGNQTEGSNTWDTTWMIYNENYTLLAKVHPYELISTAGSAYTTLYNDTNGTLKDYKNSKVYILYERNTPGNIKSGQSSNTGVRLDGRWLYSRTTDPTTLRLRVAKKSGDTLSFMSDGISWAEINDGTNNGSLETADTSNLTKILNLSNRTTEVTAKINPVGYKVTGMYMLSSGYSSTSANNGYSTDINDYDDMNVSGTATTFTNTRDNRMVIVVEQIPDANLVVYHQMYGGDGSHKIPGFFYTKVELFDGQNGNLIDMSSSSNNYGTFTNKQNELVNFTSEALQNSGRYLKVTLRTVMTGSATFYQWYENDHNGGYNEIDSATARGSAEPVEKEIWIDVNTLYEANTLSIQNLDYYSDLQASDSININHELTDATKNDGLSGTTYNKVTVVDSSGNAVSGGTYIARAKTTTVDSSFITEENANAGYQIKVEIWTVPTLPSEFDKFWLSDQTTEMTTSAVGGIAYTVGQTEGEYQKATAMVPISYFFKYADDGSGNLVYVFDSNKKDFTLYSSLELGYEYEITYTYPSKIWKGDQAYQVTGYFTADEFQLLNAARNGFNSENDKKTFIYSKAPYEDNYRQVLSWNCSSATVNVDSNNAKKLIIGVATTAENDTDVNLTIQLPLAATLTGEGTDNAKFEPTLTDGKVIYDVANGFNKANIVLTYMTHPRYSINGVKEQIADEVYLQAPQSVVKNVSGEQKDVYFSYWSLKDQETGSEYARCYSQNLNSAFYKDTIAVAVYENETKEAFDDRVPTENDKTAKIEILEQSRNQWTDKLSTNAAWDSADRLISDYLLTFTYNGKTIKNISGMKYGILFESAGDLDVDATTEEYITDSAHYSAKDNADAVTAAKAAASTFLQNNNSSGANYLLSIKNASTMDNKNQVEYAYTIAGNNELHRELKYYRVYAFLKTSTGEITISDPIYLTIYDVASIQNGSAEMQSQMNTD